MISRVLALLAALVALVASMFLAGCGANAQLNSIMVTPDSASIQNVGGTAQFQATGFYIDGKNGTQTSKNLTNQVIWSSSVVGVATVDANGLATATGAGATTITATGGNGGITGSASLTVFSLDASKSNPLLSIRIIPSDQTVQAAGGTVQHLAIGNFQNSPTTQDLTNQVKWLSSDGRVATIDSGGLATAGGGCANGGETTITALAPPSAGRAVTGTAHLTLGSCGANNLPTLTVYKLGQGSGRVTSSTAAIDCESGVTCAANLALNTQVSLTAIADPGSYFVGWSANCRPEQNSTCTLTMVNNQTVAAIFNVQH